MATQPRSTQRKTKASRQVAAATPMRLRAPRWNDWIARDEISLPQAALLSMGIAPFRGVIGLLSTKPRRNREFRRREKAFQQAHAAGKFQVARELPRTLTAMQALEFAASEHWTLSKGVLKALERMRYEVKSNLRRSDTEPSTNTDHASANRPIQELVFKVDRHKFNGDPSVSHDPGSTAQTSVVNKVFSASRGDQTLRLFFGAMLLVVRDIAKQHKIPSLLKGEQINRAELGRRVEEILDSKGLKGSASKERNFTLLASDALQHLGNAQGGSDEDEKSMLSPG